MANNGLIFNTYSTHHSHWVTFYAPKNLKNPLQNVHTKLEKAIEQALNSNYPQLFAIKILYLLIKRFYILNEVYSKSAEARAHGRTTEHISLKILLDFLSLAGRRLPAREIVATGKVNKPNSDFMSAVNSSENRACVVILDKQGRKAITFDGLGRIIEYEYNDLGKMITERYLTDPSQNLDYTAWGKDGKYHTSLQWITEYRTLKDGTRQNRAFTGFGTLNYNWQ